MVAAAAPVPMDGPMLGPMDGKAILARATQAAGGEEWTNVRTLILRGRAVFWGEKSETPRSSPDTYVMYRAFDPGRQAAHTAEGKLRIIIADKGRLISTIGYDGQETWTEKGVIPKAQADEYWANNFGFGIIRHASKPGFVAERVADANVDGHPAYMVRLIDPQGTVSLFGIDKKSFAIRMVGFSTPRGWHIRTYDAFFHPRSSLRWLQAGKVTLTYNGVKQNEIYWSSAQINAAIEPQIFSSANANFDLDVKPQ